MDPLNVTKSGLLRRVFIRDRVSTFTRRSAPLLNPLRSVQFLVLPYRDIELYANSMFTMPFWMALCKRKYLWLNLRVCVIQTSLIMFVAFARQFTVSNRLRTLGMTRYEPFSGSLLCHISCRHVLIDPAPIGMYRLFSSLCRWPYHHR